MIISTLLKISLSVFSIIYSENFATDIQYPSNIEIVNPIYKSSFNNEGNCPERVQGGNPTITNGYLVFNGSVDGNRQVDPQIAVGGGFILEGSNSGLLIFTKDGNFVQGVSQKCFNQGIDPKMFFDIHNRNFVFDLWWYYDSEKLKPVNMAISATDDPRGAWYIYPVSRTEEVDGGGIGYSKKWIAYSYPGGEENTFVMKSSEMRTGKSSSVYHFKGSLGHPVFVQDDIDDLYFFDITDDGKFVIRKISENADGKPISTIVSEKPHGLQYIDYPPQSHQKGTDQKVSSGDRNPKNLVLQNGSIWFSQAVECLGRSAVQWHQIDAKTGKILQTGLISDKKSSYIQTTIAVNKNNDVLIGFQEVNEHMFISPRFAFRLGKDKKGKLKNIKSIGEGKGFTDGLSWGDYSGSIIDGDNLQDLWTIQSITNTKGRGETVIAKVPFTKNK